jgi:hypothetical protein
MTTIYIIYIYIKYHNNIYFTFLVYHFLPAKQHILFFVFIVELAAVLEKQSSVLIEINSTNKQLYVCNHTYCPA